MRSAGGTAAAPSPVTSATNFRIACLAAPSFHDGSGSVGAAPVEAAAASAKTTSVNRLLLCMDWFPPRTRSLDEHRHANPTVPIAPRRLDLGPRPDSLHESDACTLHVGRRASGRVPLGIGRGGLGSTTTRMNSESEMSSDSPTGTR